MKKRILFTMVAGGIACGLLVAGCYQFLGMWQLRTVTALGWEGDRYLWMEVVGGTIRWDVDQRVITHRTFLTPSDVTAFFASKDGRVWGYGYDAIWLFQADRWIHMNEIAGVQRESVFDMLQTSDGTIWLATSHGFRTWDEESQTWESTSIDQPGRTLAEASDGSLWFGLYEEGVIRMQHNEQIHWTTRNGLIDNRVMSILPARDGTVWVGTLGGVGHWDGSKWERWSDLGHPDADGLGVFQFLETQDGAVWAATSQDFARWKDGQWTAYWGSPTCFTAHPFLGTSDGILWAGCDRGLFRWTGLEWSGYGEPEGIADSHRSRLIEGSNGILYASTASGIYQYVPEQDRWLSFPQ